MKLTPTYNYYDEINNQLSNLDYGDLKYILLALLTEGSISEFTLTEHIERVKSFWEDRERENRNEEDGREYGI